MSAIRGKGREYFSMRQELNEIKQQKATLLLKIYDGGQNAILASKQLTDIEVREATAPLIAENEEMSLQQISKVLDYTKEGIRKIEQRGLKNLRDALGGAA